MRVVTTGGEYIATQASTDSPEVLHVVTTDAASMQLLLDALETLYGADTPVRGRNGLWHAYVAREHFAQWVAMEVREYLTYTDFTSAILDAGGL